MIRDTGGYRARAEALARATHYRPFKFPEESLEMLNDADCSIDHLMTAHALERDLALPVPCAPEKTTAAIRLEREWPR